MRGKAYAFLDGSESVAGALQLKFLPPSWMLASAASQSGQSQPHPVEEATPRPWKAAWKQHSCPASFGWAWRSVKHKLWKDKATKWDQGALPQRWMGSWHPVLQEHWPHHQWATLQAIPPDEKLWNKKHWIIFCTNWPVHDPSPWSSNKKHAKEFWWQVAIKRVVVAPFCQPPSGQSREVLQPRVSLLNLVR